MRWPLPSSLYSVTAARRLSSSTQTLQLDPTATYILPLAKRMVRVECPPPLPGKVRDLLAVAGAQLRFIPIIAPDRVDLRDVEFSLVKRNAMRRVQAREHRRPSAPACPVCLASGKASTVPSLVSVTSSTPPGLKAICRACGASAKMAIWKPGGSFRRVKSSFSEWCAGEPEQRKQGTKYRRASNPEPAIRAGVPGDNAGVTGLPQFFAAMGTRSFYIRFRQNYPALRFFAPASRAGGVTMCCGLKT